MPNYQDGKIYAIRSHLTDKIYIGSTCQPLYKRLHEHKKSTNRCSSKEISLLGDIYIELIENLPCKDRNELTKREGELIRANDKCVNIRIDGRTTKEKSHDWYMNNKEKVKEKVKLRRETQKSYIKNI